MNAEPVVYLDSSAIVKLVVDETESDVLRRYLSRRPERVSCALARVEVVRAVRPHGTAATKRARQLLDHVDIIHLDDDLLDAAAMLDIEAIRSLDAIHIASGLALGDELSVLVTYDRRMAEAAKLVGLQVESPC